MAKLNAAKQKAANEREQLINRFVIRIFKGKALGLSRAVTMLKMKKFIRGSNRKWTTQIEDLFDNTWRKEVPPEILEKFKPKEPQRIMPNRVVKVSIGPDKIKPNKRAYIKDETDKENEPDDIDDPKWDEPEFKLPAKSYKCANCSKTFVRDHVHTNRMLCPECLEKLDSSFNDSNDNFIYAAEQELGISKKDRILNIKPL